MPKKTPTPDEVLAFKKPCTDANRVNVQFLNFRIRNLETNDVIFETSMEDESVDVSQIVDWDDLRRISYTFEKGFLEATKIGTTVKFSIGDEAIENFRMIERHYFKDELIKSFDFNFPFCIPNTVNTWECCYEMPKLSKKKIEEMINSPNQTKSDSFYFINDGELIMHNQASYSYK